MKTRWGLWGGQRSSIRGWVGGEEVWAVEWCNCGGELQNGVWCVQCGAAEWCELLTAASWRKVWAAEWCVCSGMLSRCVSISPCVDRKTYTIHTLVYVLHVTMYWQKHTHIHTHTHNTGVCLACHHWMTQQASSPPVSLHKLSVCSKCPALNAKEMIANDYFCFKCKGNKC